ATPETAGGASGVPDAARADNARSLPGPAAPPGISGPGAASSASGASPAIVPSSGGAYRGGARAGGGARPPGATSPSRGNGARDASDITLTADEGTSSIIACGDPRLLSQIEKLIVQLDVRQPQVMVQALVVSLSESQSMNLGVELEGQLNLSADTVLRLS